MVTQPVRSLGSSLARAANNRYLIQTGRSPKNMHFPSFKASVRKARPQQGSLRDPPPPGSWAPAFVVGAAAGSPPKQAEELHLLGWEADFPETFPKPQPTSQGLRTGPILS